MALDEVATLVADEKFATAVEKMLASSPLENTYFIACIVASVISVLALSALAYQTWLLRQQVRSSEQQAKFSQDQLKELRNQIELDRKQARANHESRRREFAIELLIEWSKSLKQEARDVRDFIASSSRPVCERISKSESFTVEEYNRAKLERALSHKGGMELEGGEVSSNASGYLRWVAVSYLNMLDAVLSARLYNVGDVGLIESQFKYLIKDGAMREFRSVVGEDHHPAIARFVSHISEEAKKDIDKGAGPADSDLATSD